MRKASFPALTAMVVTLGAGLLTGCGSGNGSDGSAADTTGASRTASINAVQGARRLFQLLSTGFDVPARSASLPGVGGVPLRAWIRHTLDAVRQHTAHAGQSRQEGEPPAFDAALGLYVTTQESDTETRFNYFTDEAGQNSAGFYSLTVQGEPEQFPMTLVITYQITAGSRTGAGTVTFVLSDEQGESGRISGRDTKAETGISTQFDLVFTTGGAAVSGNATVTDADGTVEFRNLVQNENGLTAELSAAGVTGTITQNADGGGTLRFNNASGPTLAAWDTEGAGTITQPNGTVETIADFDTQD